MIRSIQHFFKFNLWAFLGNIYNNHWRVDHPLLGSQQLDKAQFLDVVQVLRAVFAINIQEVAANE